MQATAAVFLARPHPRLLRIGRWGPDGIALVRGGIVALPPRLRGPRCSMSLSVGGGAGASEDRGFSYGTRSSALTYLV